MTALAIRDEQHYLATVSEVRALVERIEDVGDAKALADKARAAQVWGERAKLGAEQVNLAAAARLWAERRAGELLREMPKHPPGPDANGDRSHAATDPPTLEDLRISKHESSRWQSLAEIPEESFAEAVEAAAEDGLVTATAVRRLAIPISDELLAKQQRDTLIQGLDRAVRALELSEDHARGEVARLLAEGDAGPFTPSRFDKVAGFATAFAAALRKAGIDG